jgi:2-phospho-L-lactate guanylyltransferase
MVQSRIQAVLPVKPFACAKTRLAGVLAAGERAALAQLMFEDVLDVLTACHDIFAGTLVITSDPQAAALARRRGAAVLADVAGSGINAAVTYAIRQLHADDALLVVPSDIPQVTRAALAQAAAAVRTGRSAAIGIATRDGGTNLLACRPARAMAPLFGPNSFERHRVAALRAGLAVQTLALPELSLDIDRPDDLRWFLMLNSNTRSHAFLSRISPNRLLDQFQRENARPVGRAAAEVW